MEDTLTWATVRKMLVVRKESMLADSDYRRHMFKKNSREARAYGDGIIRGYLEVIQMLDALYGYKESDEWPLP